MKKEGEKARKIIKIVIIFTFLYMILFAGISIYRKNYEFMFYIVFVSLIIILLAFLRRKIHLPVYLIVALSLLGLLHFAGGNVFIQGARLYDQVFFNGAIRYDQVVHALGSFLFVFLGYNLLSKYLDDRIKKNAFLLPFLLVLLGLGFGAFYEIVELFGVVFFGGGKGVGTYINNAVDLVYNTIGAIIASMIIFRYNKKLDRN